MDDWYHLTEYCPERTIWNFVIFCQFLVRKIKLGRITRYYLKKIEFWMKLKK
jgi:hypothetical protein